MLCTAGCKWYPLTWIAQSVYDTAQELWADRNINNLTGTLDGVSLLNGSIGGEYSDADLRDNKPQRYGKRLERRDHMTYCARCRSLNSGTAKTRYHFSGVKGPHRFEAN